MSFKIALAQLYSYPLMPEVNLNQAFTCIQEAASKGAHLVVLPEYCLTSWDPDHDLFSQACSHAWSQLSKFRELALKLRICIVPGTLIEVVKEEDGKSLYNTAIFIDTKGNIVSSYRKKNLWISERDHLTANADVDPHQSFVATINGLDVRIGMLICWDLAFASAFTPLIVQGARLIIIPTFWLKTDRTEDHNNRPGLKLNPEKERLFLDTMCASRALEFSCAVAMCNVAGPKPDPDLTDFFRPSDYLGRSQVCMPFVGPVTAVPGSEQEILYAVVDTGVLKMAEANYQTRADLKKHFAEEGEGQTSSD